MPDIHALNFLALLGFGTGYAYGQMQGWNLTKILFTALFAGPGLYVLSMTGNTGAGALVTLGAIAAGYMLDRGYDVPDFGGLIRQLQDKFSRFEQSQRASSHDANQDRTSSYQQDRQRHQERERQRREEEMRANRARANQEKARKEQQKRDSDQRSHSSSGSQGAGGQDSRSKPETPKDTRTAAKILGLKPGYSETELRKAYLEQTKRLHPDRWQDRPAAIRKAMEDEQKLVNAAHDKLKSRFG